MPHFNINFTPQDPKPKDTEILIGSAYVQPHEQDGHPGATVSVESQIAMGDIYIAQRNRIQYYEGKISTEGVLSGWVQDRAEQVVVVGHARRPALEGTMLADHLQAGA